MSAHLLNAKDFARFSSCKDRLTALFRRHRGEWIDARDVERAGKLRSTMRRLRELREDGMEIEMRRQKDEAGAATGDYQYRWRG